MAEAFFISENFRDFPSSMPIRSPSPDTKVSNKLNRTISPAIQIHNQQQYSPSSMHNSRRFNEEQDLRMQNSELREQLNSLQVGGGTFSNDEINRLRQRIKQQDHMIWSYKRETQKATEQGSSFLRETRVETTDDLRKKLLEKQRVINELKKILANMSDASSMHHSNYYSSPIGQEYRENIRILELENERLSEIVNKLSRKDANGKLAQENKMLGTRVEQLLIENNELEQQIERFKRNQTEETVELNKINNMMASQIKMFGSIEEKNKNLERENEKLIRMLKDSKQSQKGVNSSRNLEQQIARLQYQNRNIKERSSAGPEKMTIAKIKEQYNENLKMFKQTVCEEVSRQFEKFQMTIKALYSKLDAFEQRTSRLHTQEDIASPPLDRDISPVVHKMSRSLQAQDFNSPGNHQTKKKVAVNQRFLQQTQPVEVKSEVEDDPVIFRLEAQLYMQKRQKNELSQKYNQLTADYNNLNQAHVNSLNDIQKYMNEIKKLKDTIDQSRADLQKYQSHVEEVTQNKINNERQHIEEVTRVRQSSMTEADRIRLNYQQKLEQLKSMAEDQINRLNDTYNQQIIVLRQNIEEKSSHIVQMQKKVRAKETKQQQEVADQQAQIARLQAQINEHQNKLNEQKILTRDYEDQTETRKRSYTVLESNYQSLQEEHIKLIAEKQAIQLECNEIRRQKEILSNEHRTVTDNLREANQLVLQQMQDQHERNRQLSGENSRLEDRCRQLIAFHSEMQINLTNTKSELEQIKQLSNNENSTRISQLYDVIRQAEQIKAIMSTPEASAVIDDLVKVLAELRTQRDGLFTKITTLTRDSENSVLRHKGQLLNLEKQNKLLHLKLETVQKELEIRMAESDTLRNLLEQRVRTTEDRTSASTLMIKETFQIDTRDLDRVQLNYTEGLTKLQILIKELEDIRAFDRPPH